ncbi:hypothetical protein ABB37_08090 [Leptomonas pyrrhocoris]|uniref:Uncharacterized protein n=1 Tax=Leptomonas pyrrhocoris TaxID=157538 RepID=A0A0N0DSH0_LEPPY|nr:hypothetical protein ABB37_08090 [Leptomonas pyrrhocoris]KPA75922.1 hypothetical protein ABB37_08090 [Leptomonas pyrrhocoris]|eukprot:XP_015654361.1 hypothetical protein ABB37_08090 [Leptomonas pyrrhocoris]
MGLSRYLPYAVLCVYYAWCATVLFTADLLLFVPRYFLVERHDTRSRWLGWRGEAQLQPLLPTAFQYARANAEDGADSEGGTPSISSNTTTTTSSSSSNSSSSRRHRGGSGSANMSVTCCVLAREGVARIRSLRSSMQPWWGQPQQTAVVRPTRTSSTATSSSSSPDVSDTSYTLRDTDDSGEDAEEEGGTVSLKDSPLGVVGIARSNAVSSDTAEDDDQEGIDGAGDASEDTQEASGSSRNSRQKRRAAMTKQCHAAQEAGAPVTDALFHGVDVRADLKGGNGDVQNEEVEEGEGESAMRAAVPAWCMVVFRRHDNNTISRIKASHTRASRDEDEEPPASRIAGQYGFLPPWYAAHARAQLLLAHVDPIFRMLAEVMCLRGWAASSPQTGKDTAKPSSSVEHARSFSRDSASFRCTAPVLLVVACRRFLSGLYVFCQVMAHTLVRVLFAIVQGSFPSLSPLGKTSGTAKVAAAAATATLAGLAGGPFHRLQRALRTRVARHVADTHHTFDVFAVTAATVPTNDGWPFTSSSTAAVHDDSSGGDAAQATAEKGDSVKTPLGASGHHPQRQPPSRRVSAARPVTSCRRSLGVYWLHGRQPNPTEAPCGTSSAAPAPPLVILLLCPSLLQGNGLYPFAVARISRICQLLTLAGEWRQAAGNASSRGEKEEENGAAAAAAAFASAAPAQWHAAVPVVELATYTNASGVADAISRPSLTLKDLRLVVHRLRSLEQQPSSSSQKSSTDPPASTSAARRVVIVAVGWSEAASLLLELAMTQQQPQQNTAAAAAASPSSQSRQDAEDSAHLDGLICLSHTLSSTFQLLPQQCDTSLAVMQPLQRSSGLAVSSPSMTTLAQRRRSEVAAHDNGYVEKSSERHENSLMGLSFASLLPSPHIPRVLSRLTTGPARLLLLLTRQQMIADNLIAQRHRQEEEGEETAKEKDGGGGGGGARRRRRSAALLRRFTELPRRA